MTKSKKVIVLGAGIVGVTSAYFLAKSNCQVTLIEQNPEAGLETSFANGSLITPSMSDPWASPEIPRFIFKWMGREDSPFLVLALSTKRFDRTAEKRINSRSLP